MWISGATQGIGASLASRVPYPNSRVINISRRVHPDLETVQVDLRSPKDWDRLAQHFAQELGSFQGRRAIFFHNASYGGARRFVGESDAAEYRHSVLANVAAPLVVAESFLRACRADYESGLVLMSSAAARIPLEGDAVYSAGKAAIEQWVKTVGLEIQRRTGRTWVVAVRPGFVDSPATRLVATLDEADYPASTAVRRSLEDGDFLTSAEAADAIWSKIPPDPDVPLLMFGSMPSSG